MNKVFLFFTACYLVIFSLLLGGCTGGSSGTIGNGGTPAGGDPVVTVPPNPVAIVVTNVVVPSDSKEIQIQGSGLDAVSVVQVMNSAKTVIKHSLTISGQSGSLLTAIPSSENLVLQDGDVLRIE